MNKLVHYKWSNNNESTFKNKSLIIINISKSKTERQKIPKKNYITN